MKIIVQVQLSWKNVVGDVEAHIAFQKQMSISNYI
jgi:hypothetical protein